MNDKFRKIGVFLSDCARWRALCKLSTPTGRRVSVRSQVLMAASMKFRVFWNVVPCSHVGADLRFRGANRPDDGGSMRLWNVGNFNMTTRRYIPEDSKLQKRIWLRRIRRVSSVWTNFLLKKDCSVDLFRTLRQRRRAASTHGHLFYEFTDCLSSKQNTNEGWNIRVTKQVERHTERGHSYRYMKINLVLRP
jgi:hypothetical protein